MAANSSPLGFPKPPSSIPHFGSLNPEPPSLQGIARTLLETGHLLTNSERTYLHSLSEQSISWKENVGSFLGIVGKINGLSVSILSRKTPLPDAQKAVSSLVFQSSLHSPTEEKALAGLLLSYEHELQHSFLVQETDRLAKTGKTVGRKEIGLLVDTYNATGQTQPERAGFLAFEREGNKVYFDQIGRLVLGAPEKKVVEPFSFPIGNQHLDVAKIDRIKATYHEITDRVPYNNIGPMLDLMQFFTECRTTNPNLTLREAFDAFQPNPAAIYNKYQAGDCMVLAGTLQARLQEEGIVAATIGEYTGPNWAQPPSQWGGPGRDWNEYDVVTENVHHCRCVTHFSDQEGTEHGMYFNFFAQFDAPIKEGTWKKLQESEAGGKKDTLGNIANVGHILKMQIAGKTKMVMGSPLNPESLLGIDLLRGNLYLSSAASKGLEGIPLNGKGKFSLNLQDLQTPDNLGHYFVNGVLTQMTHREALTRLVALASGRFHFPVDFVENVLSLAQHSNALFDEIFLNPAATARALLKEVEHCKTMINEVNACFFRYHSLNKEALPELTLSLMRIYAQLKSELSNTFNAFKDAVDSDQPKEAKRLAVEMEAQYEQISRMAEQIDGQPQL